jgi:sialidase-1
MVRSKDEAKTWSAPEVLYDGSDDDRDPHIASLRDGKLVCSFFPYRHPSKSKPDFETSIIRSSDGGLTWDKEHRVLARQWACSAPVREMPDGTLLLGVYHEEGETAYGGLLRSTDKGNSWSDPIPIGRGSGVRLDAETDLVQLRDGSLYAALRSDRTNMHFAISRDLGLNWTDVKDIGFKGHSPHFTRLSKGEILLSHRLPQTALHISRDEAKSWEGPHQIDDKIGAYPSTVELKDGTVLIVYYEEGAESAIRARRFQVADTGIKFLPP